MDSNGKPAGAVEANAETEEEAEEVELTRAPDGDGDGEALIELLLAGQEAHAAETPAAEASARIDGVVVGEVAALDAAGAPRVTFPGGPEGGIAARAIAAIGPDDVGCEVALMFEGGDPARPLVMCRMHVPAAARPKPEAKADGDRLEFTAEKEIVLRCGNASITLTRAGKILIRGAYVLSRSSGVHRIQGGSVQIN
jgi:hypothetical protein